MDFKGSSILITGGTGSFGKACARYILQHSGCDRLIIFSRDEWKQSEMQREDPLFGDSRLRYFLGDVRDKERLLRAFHGVDYVIHAAALKQVPAAEYNPSEFIKTNILGAMNVIEAAIDKKVLRVLALSTDKAVNPNNLYGATKLCSDKLFVSGNVYAGKQDTHFSVVRYGNVLGSRGSILPQWQALMDAGAQTLFLTHSDMTRFWITLSDAVHFVIDSLEKMVGGEISIPKIPSMKIADMAKALFPKVPIKLVGVRAGEKIHEILLNIEEARHAVELKDRYIIYSEKCMPINRQHGKSLPENFCYASNTNPQQLTEKELQNLWKEMINSVS